MIRYVHFDIEFATHCVSMLFKITSRFTQLNLHLHKQNKFAQIFHRFTILKYTFQGNKTPQSPQNPTTLPEEID